MSKPIEGDGDRAPRIQIVAALLLLLVLVIVPLYLWHRPRAVADDGASPSASLATGAPILGGDAGLGMIIPDGGSPLVTLGDMKMLECHDPGSRRTSPTDCDRLPAFEHAVMDSIRAEGACGAGAGEVLYIVDVSTLRKKSPILVTVSKDGHALKSGKVATDCAVAVKKALSVTALDPGHAHARYKLDITASYK